MQEEEDAELAAQLDREAADAGPGHCGTNPEDGGGGPIGAGGFSLLLCKVVQIGRFVTVCFSLSKKCAYVWSYVQISREMNRKI